MVETSYPKIFTRTALEDTLVGADCKTAVSQLFENGLERLKVLLFVYIGT